MARVRSVYICQQCVGQSTRWQGKCPECGAWNSLQEELLERKALGMALASGAGAPPVAMDSVDSVAEERFSSGLEELDRVLGGGLVQGSLVLLGGPPGIGKSTLLLQVARHLASQRPPVLYVSGEESPRQIRLRAERLGPVPGGVLLLPETSLEAIEARIHEVGPGLVIVDSIQTLFRSDLAPAPGSVTQVRECAASLMCLAKTRGVPVILVGHVTKGGEIAGPRVLEHLVDTVLHFEGHGVHSVRALRSVKNRFGGTHEVGLFQMGARGLDPIPDASRFFLSQRAQGAPGTVVFPSMEGSRPVLVEVQALVAESFLAAQGVPPTRRAVGLDGNRLSLLLAVLQKRTGGLGLHQCDVYANVAGGMRLLEPALDLPLVLAIASSRANLPLDPGVAACGEVGLGGEIRAVSGLEARLRELAKLGFQRCLIPARSLSGEVLEGLGSLKLQPVTTLAEALRALGLPTSVERSESASRQVRRLRPKDPPPAPGAWPPRADPF